MKICTVAASVGAMLFLVATGSHALERRQLRSEEQQIGAKILAADGIEETAGDNWNVLLVEKRRNLAGQVGMLAQDGGNDEEKLIADARRTT
ncbi:hypothetical protein V7S43_009193 [Phytophthora oleae]|uniref:RxLR effector protein n=1 Tax=Phytophthora oleae TaxID=2107226 RepID=A0ABD3FL76_9STRA